MEQKGPSGGAGCVVLACFLDHQTTTGSPPAKEGSALRTSEIDGAGSMQSGTPGSLCPSHLKSRILSAEY